MFKSATTPATETYIWNSSIEGDELCIESLKELKQQQRGTSEKQTSEAIKIKLETMFKEMKDDFDKLKPKIKKIC